MLKSILPFAFFLFFILTACKQQSPQCLDDYSGYVVYVKESRSSDYCFITIKKNCEFIKIRVYEIDYLQYSVLDTIE